MKPTVINNSLCLVTDSGDVFARDITAYLTYPGKDYNVLTVPAEGDWTLDGLTAKCGNVVMEFTPLGEGLLVRTVYTNVTGATIDDPETFYAFSCSLNDLPTKILCTRPTDDNGNMLNEMRSQVDTIAPVWGARYDSCDFVAYNAAKGNGIFGFATYKRYVGTVKAGGDGRYEATQFLEHHPLENGASVTSDLVLIMPCGDIATEGLPAYAKLVREYNTDDMPAKEGNFDVPVGFCTWYYYASKINADIIRENMDSLDAHREDIPVKYVQIDDGWFSCWGDWDEKEEFGAKMKDFADEIKSRGYTPGIWVAAFGASDGSKVWKDHPEYFVHMKCGLPYPYPSFDFSVPETCEYIKKLFHRLSHEWGYRYIKIDIITGRLVPMVHKDPEFTTMMNYRKGLQVMREAVTDDTFLLACTAPLAAAAGLVDGMRVSCDVFERWESLRDVFNSVLKRYYTHKTWYINDADCLLVRTKDEEDEQCWRLCTRTDTEIKTYVTAMAASGGAVMLSDKLPLLKDHQFELISKLFPLNTEAAVPLDLMDSFIPGVLDFGTRNGTRTIALINWGDADTEMCVPDSAGKLAFEFWGQDFMGETRDNIRTRIEPHGCRVYFLTDPADGAVVGTDSSVVMNIENGRKNKDGEKLCIAKKTADGWVAEWA
ncbi:MAG: alpha-galactosidase [Clostridia bacterium]|nr:alpha-galactosidase [Clostridia bacterium]